MPGVVGVAECSHCHIRKAWHEDGLCDLCWKYVHARKREMIDPAQIPRRYPDYIPEPEPERVRGRKHSRAFQQRQKEKKHG